MYPVKRILKNYHSSNHRYYLEIYVEGRETVGKNLVQVLRFDQNRVFSMEFCIKSQFHAESARHLSGNGFKSRCVLWRACTRVKARVYCPAGRC